MSEIKEGKTYYLKDGTQVCVEEILKSGKYLVSFYAIDEDGYDTKLDRLSIVDEVYTKEPDIKKLKEIEDMNKDIDIAERLVKQLRSKIKQIGKKYGIS